MALGRRRERSPRGAALEHGACEDHHRQRASPRLRRVRSKIIKRSDTGFVVQPRRWVIERTFAWACINRRLARDVERFAETARALVQIAMIEPMSRRIARYRDF
jgi:transposase